MSNSPNSNYPYGSGQYTMAMLNNNQSNFNRAYIPNRNEVPQRDVRNKNELIHNNLNDNVVNEIISEYVVHIDGADRDTTIYPNPFNFTVSLGGAGSNTVNGVVCQGVPNPRIDRNFKNIKQIKIKYVMLPKNYKYLLETDASGYRTYTPDTNPTILGNYRYLILRIKELETNKTFSTNDNYKTDSFILYKDTSYSDAVNELWIATQPTIIYYNTNLKNLSKLTIEILDPSGNQLYLKSNVASVISNISNTDINNPDSTQTNFATYNWTANVGMEIILSICENDMNIQKNYM